MTAPGSYCENCGAALSVGQKFCEQCGAPVAQSAGHQSPQPSSVPPDRTPEPPPQPPRKGPEAPPPPAAEGKSKKKTLFWVFGIVITLLLGAGGWIGYNWYWLSSKYGYTFEDLKDQEQLRFELENCMQREVPEMVATCYLHLALLKDGRACKYVLPEQRETCRTFMKNFRKELQGVMGSQDYEQLMNATFRISDLQLARMPSTPGDSPDSVHLALGGLMEYKLPGGQWTSVAVDEGFILNRQDGLWYVDLPSVLKHNYFKGASSDAHNPPATKERATPDISQIDPNEKAGYGPWMEFIRSGKEFSILFDKTSDKFDDSQYSGDWRSDPMGSIKGGETYTCSYNNGTFSCIGYDQGVKGAYQKNTDNVNLDDYRISLWGRGYSFDEAGNVFDPQYGLVGRLSKVPYHSTNKPPQISSNWKPAGKVGTDGTGDRQTKKKGGTYLRLDASSFSSYNDLKISAEVGSIDYVTLHGRYEGGIWKTLYQGPNKLFNVKEVMRAARSKGKNLTTIIVSINGGHERYEPVKSSASVQLR